MRIERYFHCPQTKLREGNVFTSVCDSVHGRGVSVQGGLYQGDPPYTKEWAVRILLECILVTSLFLTVFRNESFFPVVDSKLKKEGIGCSCKLTVDPELTKEIKSN